MEDFDEDEETMDWPFRELLGSLMWLAISTHPNIPNAVRFVARYSSVAALGILTYISGTS